MKKKNHRILFQTGIVITLIFTISLIFCVIYIIWTVENIIVKSKRVPILNDFHEISKTLTESTHSKQISNYLLEYPDRFSKELTQKVGNARVELGYSDIDMVNKGFTTFPERERYVVAQYDYYLDNDFADELVNSSFYDEFYCVSVDSLGKASVLLSATADQDKNKYNLGDTYNEYFTEITPVKKLLKGDDDFAYELTGNILTPDIYAYYPVKNQSGNTVSYYILHYNMFDIISFTILDSFEIAIIVIVIILALLDVAFLLFLRRNATIPLLHIKSALRDYMENKDSSVVVEKMSKVKTKNELKMLSEDVSKLAVELDNYASENIKLAENKERVKAEITLASQIQDDSLIKEFPDTDNISLYATMTPAKEVGGDFYDFFYIDDTHLAIVIADVSGKGIPASLVMMEAMTSIRNYTMMLTNPADIFEKVNEDLCARNSSSIFVTAWLGILDLKTGLLTVSSAGHEYPALKLNGKYELSTTKHSFVLGGMPGIKYRTEEIQLKPGDSVFVYTDGVPEATDSNDNLFGKERMLEVLNSDPDALPEEALKNVKAAINRFLGTAQQFDDLTMLCLRFKGTL